MNWNICYDVVASVLTWGLIICTVSLGIMYKVEDIKAEQKRKQELSDANWAEFLKLKEDMRRAKR